MNLGDRKRPINKAFFLGDYATEEKAARAYNKAARDLFGDVAYQNLLEKPSNKRR